MPKPTTYNPAIIFLSTEKVETIQFFFFSPRFIHESAFISKVASRVNSDVFDTVLDFMDFIDAQIFSYSQFKLSKHSLFFTLFILLSIVARSSLF